jgi:hypothetical protein
VSVALCKCHGVALAQFTSSDDDELAAAEAEPLV